jgi:glutamine amidotransferase
MRAVSVAIIDYGMGNLFSVKHACEQVGLTSIVTHDRETIMQARAVILPGVGAFGDAMEHLHKHELIVPIKEFIASGKPFLGVCLGMQLLFSESEEFGNPPGLNIIEGKVVKFPITDASGNAIKVPQVGWNSILPAQRRWPDSHLRGLCEGVYMYFVHSFYCVPAQLETVLSYTEYEGTRYCSSVQKENIFAVQFHPEKSASEGLLVYKNWAATIAS